MKRILIINFGRHGEIFSMADLIFSIKQEYPKSSISILILDEFKYSAKVLSGIDEIITIDRKVIQALFEKKVYPKHFSLNFFIKTIRNVEKKSFDVFLNYSKCSLATYLSGYFSNQAEIKGVFYSSQNTFDYSNEWCIVLNDIVDYCPWSPFNRKDIYRNIQGLKNCYENSGCLASKDYDIKAYENIENIKRKNKYKEMEPRVVGIRLICPEQGKAIPLETMVGFLKMVRNDKSIFPLIIIYPEKNERNFFNVLNAQFEHALSVVEADFIGLPSLLKYLDILLTPDVAIKDLANIMAIPMVEVSLGDSFILKTSGTNPGDLILTVDLERRWFCGKKSDVSANRENRLVSPSDIFNAVSCRLGDKHPHEVEFDADVYKVVNSKDEICYLKADGRKEGIPLLYRTTAKSLIEFIVDPSRERKGFEYFKQYVDFKDIRKWTEGEKKSAEEMSKDLLATIRSMNQWQKGSSKSEKFVYCLDRLFSYCEHQSLTSVIARYFKAKIESIQKTSVENDFRVVEARLYKTKAHIQECYDLISHWEDIGRKSGLGKVKRQESAELL